MTQYRIKPAPSVTVNRTFVCSNEGELVIDQGGDQWVRLDASEAVALREWLDGVLAKEDDK